MTGRRGRRQTFRSLEAPNFRRYFFGQLVSMAGTFMHTIAQAWLVLDITGSASALGVVTALQFGPPLLLTSWGGVLADRFDRRRLYLAAQVIGAAQALVLGVLAVTDSVSLTHVYGLALVLGLFQSLDQPVRQTLIFDIVGPENLQNAVSLNMAMGNTSRVVGPALGGLLIAGVGVGPCFFVNASTFIAAFISMLLVRPEQLQPVERQAPGPGQLREGWAYAMRDRDLRASLLLIALFFSLSWQFDVLIPLLATFTFDGGSVLMGGLTSALALGSVVGGLTMASRREPPGDNATLFAVALFGFSGVGAAIAPTPVVAGGFLVVAGAAGIALASSCSARIQLTASPPMRGRVMAIYSTGVQGTRSVGALGFGAFAGATRPTVALALASAFAMVLTVPVWLWQIGADRRASLRRSVLRPWRGFRPTGGAGDRSLPGEAEDALAEDVAEDVRGAAHDRVGG